MIKERIICRNFGYVYDIEVEGFDEERPADREFLLGVIKELSLDKNVFMSLFMGSIDTIDHEIILASIVDPKKRFQGSIHRLQIDIDKLIITETLFENRNTSFYFFEKSVEWDSFVKMKKPYVHKKFKENRLFLKISLFDYEGITITVRKDCETELEYVLGRFASQGYSIKK